jgi:hypothetical protein
MFFNFFQRLAFGFRQEESGGEEVNQGKPGEQKKHRRISIVADDRQKDGG